MDYRAMNLAVFEGKPTPRVLFQPRIEPWYAWHKQFDCLPPDYASMSLPRLFDDLDVSMRYVHYYTDQPDPIREVVHEDVRIDVHETPALRTSVYHTPHGDLVRQWVLNEDRVWRTVRPPVRSLDDLKAMTWYMRHRHYEFDINRFDQGDSFVGPRGWPQFWVPKSPYQALAQWWMSLEDLIYALADAPDVVEAAMAAIDASYDPLYEQLIAHRRRVRIVNFGENLHEQLLNPAYFDRYFLPWYHKRSGQLRAAGIFTHIHIDGYFRALLPRLRDLPFDGIEALTPLPQGDMRLEEIAEHIGNKVLLDGIPAVLFMDTYPREQLMACAERVVELFAPRLILGVSDEVPEGAGREAIERVRLLSDWCRVTAY